MAGRKAPRYDIPNAAPEPLRLVQLFVNTVNCESGEDWLARWLEDEGVAATESELECARTVREALRELLHANNLQAVEGDPWPVLTAAADAASLSLDFARPALVARAPGAEGVVGRVLAVVYGAMADGSFARLKCCRNHHCRWAFFDYSKNRSANWCSMQLCGNRRKTRAYRARSAAAEKASGQSGPAARSGKTP
jgi:predicted RNA-binding Zn ribbon-like protein